MTTSEDHHHHRRRRAFNGMAAGVITFAMFLGVAAACITFVGGEMMRLKTAEEETEHNAETIRTWATELRARHVNIEDLQHFMPSHAHPAPYPPSSNPHTQPSPHR